MTKPALLSLSNIEVVYDGVILAVRSVSLSVAKGQVVALLGANGSGKTSTLKACSNLLLSERGKVTRGQIALDGEDISTLTPHQLVKRGMIQVLEGRHCFPNLTVQENLMTGAVTRKEGSRVVRRDLDQMYSHFPQLARCKSKQAGYLSGGEQQMLVIGRALMARPRLILLDEPSMGLAPQLVEEIFDIIFSLNTHQEVSFLIAEQNAAIALSYSHYAYVIENGRVVMQGEAGDLAENTDVKESYLGMGVQGRISFADVKFYHRRVSHF